MKIRLKTLLFGFLLVFFCMTLFPTTGAIADDMTKWKFAIPYPPGTAFQGKFEFFCDIVKKMSNGRLQLEIVNAGAGIGPMEFLNAVSTGVIESAMVYPPLHQGQIPFGVVEVGLPGGPDSYDQVRSLHFFGWSDVLSKAYAKHNVHWLPTSAQLGTWLLTKKPVNSLEDLKKLKIRAVGAYGKMMRAIGASPVVIAYAEIYTSLATGVIDGWAGSNIVEFNDSKVYEVAKYLYPLKVSGLQAAPIVINMEAWNKLPEDLKAIVEAANINFADNMRAKSITWEGEAMEELKTKGLKFSPKPSDADKARWIEAGKQVWSEFAANDPVSKELIEIQTRFMKQIIK